MTAHPRESGDRPAFLGHLRQRRDQATSHDNVAHPLPPPLAGVPVARSALLDEHDLVGSFAANARAAAAHVHLVARRAPEDLLAQLVERHGVRRAVVSAELEAVAVGAQLAGLGVTVEALSPGSAAAADLGVTSCVAALATTGTVVVRSDAAGGRGASLLPPVHLCVVPAERIVASTADVLRALPRAGLPSNLVLITGPSRSGDIEQIIALGVHGPLAVEVVVLGAR